MKLSTTYKFISVLLALLILFSGVSFRLEKHICKGELQTSFFKSSKELCVAQSFTCHVDNEDSCCTTAHDESNCCHNTSELIEGIHIEQQAQKEFKIKTQFVFLYLSKFFISSFFIKKKEISQKTINTPLKLFNLSILFQVFRL